MCKEERPSWRTNALISPSSLCSKRPTVLVVEHSIQLPMPEENPNLSLPFSIQKPPFKHLKWRPLLKSSPFPTHPWLTLVIPRPVFSFKRNWVLQRLVFYEAVVVVIFFFFFNPVLLILLWFFKGVLLEIGEDRPDPSEIWGLCCVSVSNFLPIFFFVFFFFEARLKGKRATKWALIAIVV